MSRLFEDLKAGLEEAIDHAEGRSIAGRERIVMVTRNEIQEARLRMGLAQKQFAAVIGAGVDTVRKWEQGTRAPSGAAATLVKIIAHRPSIVQEALGEAFAATIRPAGRLVIRPSGTEPVVRVMGEGDDSDLVETIVSDICHAPKESSEAA